MLLINKGKPPNSLISYRKEKYAYFDGCNKEDIRQALLKEQGNLCAYCMRRIDITNMKIEHWYPENLMDDNGCLEYNNMLACCVGHNEGDSGKYDTCDTHKKDTVIYIDPRNSEHINQIQYRSKDGTIYSDNDCFNKDLDIVLNLNSETHYLKQNRKEALDSFKQFMIKRKISGQWNENMLKKVLNEYDTKDENGERKEYSGIILWYIKRKLK
ncbi:MAG: TIGR02646 family protein [Lachnospiraceae bacterium]|nr:TIGR02646 family protein [Lachnospiraceae bacterium]